MKTKLSQGEISGVIENAAESIKLVFERGRKVGYEAGKRDAQKKFDQEFRFAVDCEVEGRLADEYNRGKAEGRKEVLEAVSPDTDIETYCKERLDKISREERKEAYDRGYESGYETAMRDTATDMKLSTDYDIGRAEGRKEAWEAARKIVDSENNGGLSGKAIGQMFERTIDYTVLLAYTADEVIEKLAAYEKQKEEITVGDELQNSNGTKVIVTEAGEYCLSVLSDNGHGWRIYKGRFSDYKKTGRHFDEVDKLLKAMQEATMVSKTKIEWAEDKMTIKKAIRELQNSINIGLCPDVESRKMAIRSLEAWEKVKEDIENWRCTPNSNLSDEQYEILMGEIINKHLQEVEGEDEHQASTR